MTPQMKTQHLNLTFRALTLSLILDVSLLWQNSNSRLVEPDLIKLGKQIYSPRAFMSRNIEELHLSPAFIYKPIQFKNITLENVKKQKIAL